MIWIVLALVIFIALGQYVRRQAEKLREEEKKPRERIKAIITIGGEMASPDEVHERLAIENEIERRKIGDVIDAGSGDGTMYLLVSVDDAARRVDSIREVLASAGVADRASLDILGMR